MRRFRIKLNTLAMAMLAGHALLATALLAMFWWGGVRHAEESAAGYQERVTNTVSAHLDAFFQRPLDALEQTRQGIRLGTVSLHQPDQLQRYFVSQVRALESVTNLSFGDASGRYINAYRNWQDPQQVHVSNAGSDGHMRSYRVDEHGQVGELLYTHDGFDVADRPWFQTGASSQESGPAWFSAYAFHSGQAVAIGVAAPVVADEGRLLGVLACDASLEQITRTLGQIALPAGGAVFVMDEENRLLADSSGRPPLERKNGQLRRLSIDEIERPAMKAAARVIANSNGRPSAQSAARIDETAYLVFLKDYKGPAGLSLSMGVSVPKSAYTQPLMAGLNRRATLAALILAVGLVVAIQLLRWVGRPLSELVAATRGAAQRDWQNKLPRSRIKELDILSNAFGNMRQELRKTLEGLEETVDARTAELAMANARLSQLSHTDSLTGLANRRAFDQALAENWQQAVGKAQPLSVIMVDVDRFKDYNDQYGHPAGDRCLKAVAGELNGVAGERGGVVARYGGEEFVVLLGDCDVQTARQIAELLRRRVKGLALPHDSSPFDRHVTISAGLSAGVPKTNDQGAQHLVDEADAALYAAKSQGRNRVVVFESNELNRGDA